MPTNSKRNITVPASKPATVTTSKPARKLASVAQAASKPATPAKPVAATTATPKPVAADTMPRGLTRDAAGIVRGATNFETYSDRDTAYLAFFGSVMRKHGHSATLRQIFDAGSKRGDDTSRKRFNPYYAGSGKATDVGAINRLIKAGYISRSADGHTLTATDTGRTQKAYNAH